MVKVIIPSSRRADTCTTPLLLEAEGIDYTLVLHDEDERRAYVAAGRDPSRIMVSNVERRLPPQRQWILDTLAQMNEWVIMLDDNIRAFTALPEPFYFDPNNRDRMLVKAFDMPCSAKRFLRICDETMIEAARRGAYLVGFATTDNGFFRTSKWHDVGYVIGKAMCVRKTHLEHDPFVRQMEDFSFTAQNLYAFGRVLINLYAKPSAAHYQRGGLGTLQDRLPDRLHDCRYLVGAYPGLLDYKPPKGDMPANCDLQLRLTTLEQVEQWRRALAQERVARE